MFMLMLYTSIPTHSYINTWTYEHLNIEYNVLENITEKKKQILKSMYASYIWIFVCLRFIYKYTDRFSYIHLWIYLCICECHCVCCPKYFNEKQFSIISLIFSHCGN